LKIFLNRNLKRRVCSYSIHTGYFTSDGEPGGVEGATHNTLKRKPGHGGDKYPAFPPDVLWIAFSIPPDSLSVITREIPCIIM
jgi:hypothetical protein